ncbi:uncharacterized protein BJ171DRAFT_576619 [Polychytrium aggregatum]|uniref:uncharacterized protein n=1 Tax=Polychytrium aggregatum TaxID=110093 RepID=UPI0022FEB8FC|nr:uncharacterized protein BJ171DRAFT_576619 [Polychytrium aggregatum]KAI9209833.1 hypothetical protein BJ171DRAFT_576619 [Polychytrium aggregatum]
MFYPYEILANRHVSGIGIVWIAATLGTRSSAKKISKRELSTVNIQRTCSHLMMGVIRVYEEQFCYFQKEVQVTLGRLKSSLALASSDQINMSIEFARYNICNIVTFSRVNDSSSLITIVLILPTTFRSVATITLAMPTAGDEGLLDEESLLLQSGIGYSGGWLEKPRDERATEQSVIGSSRPTEVGRQASVDTANLSDLDLAPALIAVHTSTLVSSSINLSSSDVSVRSNYSGSTQRSASSFLKLLDLEDDILMDDGHEDTLPLIDFDDLQHTDHNAAPKKRKRIEATVLAHRHEPPEAPRDPEDPANSASEAPQSPYFQTQIQIQIDVPDANAPRRRFHIGDYCGRTLRQGYRTEARALAAECGAMSGLPQELAYFCTRLCSTAAHTIDADYVYRGETSNAADGTGSSGNSGGTSWAAIGSEAASSEWSGDLEKYRQNDALDSKPDGTAEALFDNAELLPWHNIDAYRPNEGSVASSPRSKMSLDSRKMSEDDSSALLDVEYSDKSGSSEADEMEEETELFFAYIQEVLKPAGAKRIVFSALIPALSHPSVAAQAFHHVLVLATQSRLTPRQDVAFGPIELELTE